MLRYTAIVLTIYIDKSFWLARWLSQMSADNFLPPQLSIHCRTFYSGKQKLIRFSSIC